MVAGFNERDGVLSHYRSGSAASARHVPLLLLHSLGTDLRSWDEFGRGLPDRRLIAVDLRGHGLSDDPPGPYRRAELVADIIGILDREGIGVAVPVGVSVGGLIALACALANPDRFPAVVACACSARVGSEESWNERIARVEGEGLPAIAGELAHGWFSSSFRRASPERVRAQRNLLARTSPTGYTAMCGFLRDTDLSSELPALTQPALMVGGADDPGVRPEAVARLAGAAADGRAVIIDACGHLPNLEAPQALGSVVMRFLEEVGSAR